ncbi:MAG: HEAT repeat domain-containing protein [bacterium]|nr:MAG: HEAT repeat domain-containing protein [bacterium]
MNHKLNHGILLTLIALIFTIGLTFASIELPRLVDSFLGRNIGTPDVATVSRDRPYWDPDSIGEFKTELYLQTYHLRLIGYSCLALIIILIAVGFITNKSGLSSAGAIILFLPVFGQFALTMFFLGGLGFLRLIWLPFLDVSFNVLHLGDIVNIPYKILSYFYSLVGLNRLINLSYFITGLGLLIFFLGTLTWFYARIQNKGVANFWIYRLSRHPQYLGWIIWSYGILYLPQPRIKIMFDISNSLPWLLATMIIIGVAMLEELKMRRIQSEAYESYCRRTSFLLPLPRFVSKLFSTPLRLIFKKEYPERKREVFTMITFYTVFTIAISAFYAGFVPLSTKQISTENVDERIEQLVKIAEQAQNKHERMHAIGLLGEIGEPAIEPLISFLKGEQNYIRWNAATALGNTKSEKAVDPLIGALHDEHRIVRSHAASSLGKIGDKRAIQPLIEAFWDTERNIAPAAAEALGNMGDQEAVPTLIHGFGEMENCPYIQVGWALWKLGSERAVDAFIAGLNDERWWVQGSSAAALGKIKSEKGIEPLIEALKNEKENVRRAAVLALMEIKSQKAIKPLTDALKDEDFEVRMYAMEALKKIGTTEAMKAIKK